MKFTFFSKNLILTESGTSFMSSSTHICRENGNGCFSTHMAPFDKPTGPPGTEFRPDSNEMGPGAWTRFLKKKWGWGGVGGPIGTGGCFYVSVFITFLDLSIFQIYLFYIIYLFLKYIIPYMFHIYIYIYISYIFLYMSYTFPYFPIFSYMSYIFRYISYISQYIPMISY